MRLRRAAEADRLRGPLRGVRHRHRHRPTRTRPGSSRPSRRPTPPPRAGTAAPGSGWPSRQQLVDGRWAARSASRASPARAAPSGSRSRSAAPSDADVVTAPQVGSRPSPGCECWWSTTTRPTARSSTTSSPTGAWLSTWSTAPRPALDRLGAAAAEGAPYDLAVLDLLHAGHGRARARPAHLRDAAASRAPGWSCMTSGPDDQLAPRREPPASRRALTKPVRMSRLRTTLEQVGRGRRRCARRTPARGGGADAARRVLVVEDNEVNQLVAARDAGHLGLRRRGRRRRRQGRGRGDRAPVTTRS